MYKPKTFLAILNILLVTSTTIFSSCYEPAECILPPTSYGPIYIQALNPRIDEWRQKLAAEITPEWQGTEGIKCIDFINKDLSETYRCFEYAIQQITGFNGYIEFPEPGNASIILKKYFEQASNIQVNDLIIYTTSKEDKTVHHFATAINSTRFKSKFGPFPQIFDHMPLYVLPLYGKAIWSFRLKEKYQSGKGKQLLLQEMRVDITNIIHKAIINRKELIASSNQKYYLLPAGFALGAAYVLFLGYVFNYKPNMD